MTHAGQPVLRGERGIMVASFSPRADGSDAKMGDPKDLVPLFDEIK